MAADSRATLNEAAALERDGRPAEAARLLKKALAETPGDVRLLRRLGAVSYRLYDFPAAERSFRQAVAIVPEDPNAAIDLGASLQAQGRLDEAASLYRKALDRAPENLTAGHNLGTVLIAQGDTQGACAAYRRVLRMRPDFAEAWFKLAEAKTFTADDPDLAALERAAAQNDADGSPDANRTLYLKFALGKAYDDIGDVDRAFAAFQAGNARKRQTFAYDPADTERFLARVAEVFDAEAFRRLDGSGAPDTTPIFVVGMPRSGTTLVERVLDSHPDVHGAGELLALSRLVRSVQQARPGNPAFPDLVTRMLPEDARRIGEAYVRELRRHAPTGPRIVDKMPANFVYLGLIRLILPQAKVVHVVREPAAVGWSCFRTNFFGTLPWAYDLAEIGRYYCAYRKVMAHWRAMLPADWICEVAYDDLVRAPEPTIRRLLDHCGLAWNPACVDFQRNPRPVQTASVTQVRRPLYADALDAWRAYEPHLDPLLRALAGTLR